MKNLKQLSILFLLVSISFYGCSEDDSDDVAPPSQSSGQVVFWSDFDGPPIEVTFSGSSQGTITAISQSPPSCGSSGNVTRTLDPGTYSFSAEETSSPFRSWSGEFTISSSTSCLTFLLHL